MKSLKENKAITLIALIITIIVLLILAGVVINMTIGNEGIIGKAQGAVDMYKNAQEKEETEIKNYDKKIDNLINIGVNLDYDTLNNKDKFNAYISSNENVDNLISNKEFFKEKILKNEMNIKELSKNENAKNKIKENDELLQELKNCDYAYENWQQPIMTDYTKTLEEGQIVVSKPGYVLGFSEWKAMDGKKDGDDSGYWWHAVTEDWWQVKFPYEIRIKSVDFYNQSSTVGDNRNLAQARLYTDSSKTTPIGDSFSANANWQHVTISGIEENKIVTDTIYFYKTSGLAGIGEIVIHGDKFLF